MGGDQIASSAIGVVIKVKFCLWITQFYTWLRHDIALKDPGPAAGGQSFGGTGGPPVRVPTGRDLNV
jgi:hypothetical protein